MQLEALEARISYIQQSITDTTNQVKGYTLSLQESTQQLNSLHGHLNEALHWKNQMLLSTSLPLETKDSTDEQIDCEIAE